MNLRIGYALSFAVVFLTESVAGAACFPRNKLHLSPSPLERSNISEEKFNQIIDKAEAVYRPVIQLHKGVLKVNRLWKDNTVNASANQDGRTWEVNMYGGLARRPEVTPDGFAMVVCHELGHHLGGYSFYSETDGDPVWAANEGQSDYFAAHACTRELWKGEPELNATFRKKVLPFAQKVCDTNHSNQADRDICYRSSAAGLSLASLLAKLRESPAPKFDTPDPAIVDATYEDHPEAQCRLDTYLAGASCTVAFDRQIIPAKKLSDRFGAKAEIEAGRYSCLARDGWVNAQRPRCWFKPLLEFEGLVALPPVWTDDSGNRRVEPGETLSVAIPLTNRLGGSSVGVSGQLFSRTKGVSVETQKVSYPDIASGASVNSEQPFTVRVSESFGCGHPFEFVFRASARGGSREFPVKWHSGSKVAADVTLARSLRAVKIPDAPSDGLVLPFTVSSKLSTDVVIVDLNVEGYLPEENEYTLRLPTGEEVKLNVEGLFEAGSKVSVRVQLPSKTTVTGEWALRVRDLYEDDVAVLKAFGLRIPHGEKVSCSP